MGIEQAKEGDIVDGRVVHHLGTKPAKAKLPWYAKACIALVVLCGISGFFHVVYGSRIGVTVCLKDGWALSDTFVDLDEIAGKPLISQLHRAPTLRALIAAGIIERPKFGRDR
jgi:hypothetical protein